MIAGSIGSGLGLKNRAGRQGATKVKQNEEPYWRPAINKLESGDSPVRQARAAVAVRALPCRDIASGFRKAYLLAKSSKIPIKQTVSTDRRKLLGIRYRSLIVSDAAMMNEYPPTVITVAPQSATAGLKARFVNERTTMRAQTITKISSDAIGPKMISIIPMKVLSRSATYSFSYTCGSWKMGSSAG